MEPLHHRVTVNDLTLSVFEWHPELRGRADTILLAHATGFHARCWDRVVAHLGERHVVAMDQRGHGRSDKVFPVRWQNFGRDLVELIRTLGLARIVGVGHSMGGHAMTQAAAADPTHFQRLVLIDPVITSPAVYVAHDPWGPWSDDEPHPTAKRRNHWASPEEMYARFSARPPFSAWDPGVLRDYCTHGLLPDPDGNGYVLACPPEFESAVYMTSRDNPGVYASIRAVTVPVLIVRVMEPPTVRDMMDFRYSPTWPGLVDEFRNAREVHLPDETHFLPMEHPDLAARFILRGA